MVAGSEVQGSLRSPELGKLAKQRKRGYRHPLFLETVVKEVDFVVFCRENAFLCTCLAPFPPDYYNIKYRINILVLHFLESKRKCRD